MLSFGCPLSVSLLPRLTVSPSYDGGAYTSGYLYLISSMRCCRPTVTTRRALGSGLPSAGRMATPRHGTSPRAPSLFYPKTLRFRALSFSRVTRYLDRAALHATFAKEVVGVVTYDWGTSKKRNVSSAKGESSRQYWLLGSDLMLKTSKRGYGFLRRLPFF